MQYFYDAQVRRYLTQTIRVFSNFVVKYGDGTLVRIPVLYGDPDRQSAAIIAQNSASTVNACPRIAVYISGLDLDPSRLADATYVGKMHVREREVLDGQYTQGQGRNYTVERIMPTPFKLTMKVDIWSANTEQKLQILEQILVFFNPSLELQTTDNYLDWTSLSVLNLTGVNWSSRSVPVGANSPIDIATLTVETPIWISPPVKVKHLGVITNVITSLYQSAASTDDKYIDGLGIPLTDGSKDVSTILSRDSVTITDYHIAVYNNEVILLQSAENTLPREINFEIPIRQGSGILWDEIFAQYPGKYKAGSSTLYLKQPNGSDVIGTVAINPLDPTILTVTWDADTRPSDDLIDSQGLIMGDMGFDQSSARGTFDAIIDPYKFNPIETYGSREQIPLKLRLLIVEDLGDPVNEDGPDAWKSIAGTDFYAKANDIIEWDGIKWNVIFAAAQEADTLIYQTNIYKSPGIQYIWNGVQWAKSFDGEYKPGSWRLEL